MDYVPCHIECLKCRQLCLIIITAIWICIACTVVVLKTMLWGHSPVSWTLTLLDLGTLPSKAAWAEQQSSVQSVCSYHQSVSSSLWQWAPEGCAEEQQKIFKPRVFNMSTVKTDSKTNYPLSCSSAHRRMSFGCLSDGTDHELDQCALMPVSQHYNKTHNQTGLMSKQGHASFIQKDLK